MEGFLDAMRRYDVERAARESVHEAGRLGGQVGQEVRRQARSPEGRRLAHDARRGAQAVRARGAEAAETAQDRIGDAAQRVESQWQDAKQSVAHGARRVEHTARAAAGEARERGHMLAESGRRARRAPGEVAHDGKQAARAWLGGMGTGAGLMAAAGVVGLAGFVVLTVALVSWLNGLVGAPGGTFIVALLYVVAAAAAVPAARAARRRGRAEARRHVGEARAALAAVAQPLRRAFSASRQRAPPGGSRGIGRVEADERAYQAAAGDPVGDERALGRQEGGLSHSIPEEYRDLDRR